MTHYYSPTRRNEALDAIRLLAVFISLIAVLLGGAFATLVILHHMEDISPAYCLTGLGVYAYTAFCVMVVGTNENNR